jgi:hypothetical protein
MAILFYKNNQCPSEIGEFCGAVPTSQSGNWSLKASGSPVENDEARSCTLMDVVAGTVITLYDNPDGKTDDDWTEIKAHQNILSICISSFEVDTNSTQYSVTYHKKNGLDGKVSYIRVIAP